MPFNGSTPTSVDGDKNSGVFLAFTECLSSGRRVVAKRLSIIGTYAKSSQSPCFVQHAALLKTTGAIDGTSKVDVFHSGPPLAVHSGQNCSCQPDIVADVQLDLEEMEAIDNWLAGVEKEIRSFSLRPFEQFHILPHMIWVYSEENRRIRRRFSCSGFVIEAYRTASIELIDTQQLPLADEKVIASAYEDLIKIEATSPPVQARIGFRGRADLGLDKSGSWPIALPGYLFHSTGRLTADSRRPVPYVVAHVNCGFYPAPAG